MTMQTATIASVFNAFTQNIALGGNHVATAQGRARRIVELMGDGFYILDAIPTGSVVRGTAVKGTADIDVMVVLHHGKHIEGKRPVRVLEDVREHLSQYNARIVKKNGQAVTLYFTSWPNVDIVPAAEVTCADGRSYYIIPDMRRDRWIDTSPHYHDGAMRRLSLADRHRIQMIKTWNSAHSGYMQSFHIEVLALLTGGVDTTDWPWAIRQYFELAAKAIDQPLHHPNGDHGAVDSYLNVSDRKEVKARLVTAESHAARAWWEVRRGNPREAMRIYQMMFGNRFPSNG